MGLFFNKKVSAKRQLEAQQWVARKNAEFSKLKELQSKSYDYYGRDLEDSIVYLTDIRCLSSSNAEISWRNNNASSIYGLEICLIDPNEQFRIIKDINNSTVSYVSSTFLIDIPYIPENESVQIYARSYYIKNDVKIYNLQSHISNISNEGNGYAITHNVRSVFNRKPPVDYNKLNIRMHLSIPNPDRISIKIQPIWDFGDFSLIEGYELFRCTQKKYSAYERIAVIKQTSEFNPLTTIMYEDTLHLKDKIELRYKIMAYRIDGATKVYCGNSCEKTIVYDPIIENPDILPPIPKVELLTLKVISDKCITVRWKSIDNISGYQIIKIFNDKIEVVGRADPKSTKYTDNNANAKKAYLYKIRAYRKQKNGQLKYGEYSNALSVNTYKMATTNHRKVTTDNHLTDFDSMDGHAFESYCANILEKNGFQNVVVTQGSGDQGIDILAMKDGIKYGIQCKCYSSEVGNKAVQEAFSGKTYYNQHIGVVLTNNYFTPAAKQLAEKNGIILWNRDQLLTFVKNANQEK